MKRIIHLSVADLCRTFIILISVILCCYLLTLVSGADTYISMVFVLGVFLTARFTSGYFYGVFVSVLSVLFVNYVFTYPYFEFNFIMPGYPITIITTLTVSIITSMMTSQIKKQERVKREAEKEKMRANLLRAVSHDLRTPLTSIVGGCQAILENEDVFTRQQQRTLLEDMKKESEWLIRMVENLLSVTRIRDGEKAKLAKRLEAAEEIAAAAVSRYRKRFEEPRVEVKVPKELVMVPMDATLIEQVIVNLLENAALHAEGVSLVKLVISSSQDKVTFSVSDNGTGIPDYILPYLTNDFFIQHNDSNADKSRNMGIGLSVCNTIIKAHSGVMMAGNTEGGGAIFTFELPINDV